ncbi:MAG: putative DNA binding domain-containing protein [Lactobacillaceae bacterium]|jgi:ATP-dependent DNA helicase RecG|nr:putative DNA binding domain-containing protein [Lactobacillaceae bacterium]
MWAPESDQLEYKKAKNELPKAVWDTVSAFYNTKGGEIILGVDDKTLETVGVENATRLANEFASLARDSKFISYINRATIDINVEAVDGLEIVRIRIDKAPRDAKPVFINISGINKRKAFIRISDNDSVMTESEIADMLQDRYVDNDARPREGTSFERDIDPDTFTRIKNQAIENGLRVNEQDSDESIAYYLGILVQDENERLVASVGGLLFAGRYRSIRSRFPALMLDFVQVKTLEQNGYDDRIVTGALSNEPSNIYEFYVQVANRIDVSFTNELKIDGFKRVPVHDLKVAVFRELLANGLVHALYNSYSTGLDAIVTNKEWVFENNGEFLISLDDFKEPRIKADRNGTLIDLFRSTGLMEHFGYGGGEVYKNVEALGWPEPLLESNVRGGSKVTILTGEVSSNATGLTQSDNELQSLLEKNPQGMLLTDFVKLGMDKNATKTDLQKLVVTGKVYKTGVRRGTRYHLAG